MNRYFGYSIHSDNIPYKPSTTFLLCKTCIRERMHCQKGEIISTHKNGHFIKCPHCQKIYDEKGRFYSNKFNPSEIIDIYIQEKKKFINNVKFKRKSFEFQHFSIAETEKGELIHGIARLALNPHID